MTDGLSTSNGDFVGLFVEAICYGIYLVTLGKTLVCIFESPTSHGWKRPEGIRLVTLIVVFALCANCTLNLFFGLVRMLQTYIFLENKQPSYWINLARVSNKEYLDHSAFS